jgi:hypothetical protein
MLSLYVHQAGAGAIDQKLETKVPKLTLPFNTKPRVAGKGLWRLEMTRKSRSLTLGAGNMDCRIVSKKGHAYVLGSKEMSRGKHAWRVNIAALTGAQWIFIGVVAATSKNKLTDMSFGDATCWGFSSTNQSYKAGISRRRRQKNAYLTQVDWRGGHAVDVLLDCDEGVLKFVNITTHREHSHKRLPKNQAWIPHFNIYHIGNSFSIETMKADEWGKLPR